MVKFNLIGWGEKIKISVIFSQDVWGNNIFANTAHLHSLCAEYETKHYARKLSFRNCCIFLITMVKMFSIVILEIVAVVTLVDS